MNRNYYYLLLLAILLSILAPSPYVTSAQEAVPQFLLEWGSFGLGNGEFDLPLAIAANDQGVYVADKTRVQQFTSDGSFLANRGTFERPSGLAVGNDGSLYVVDPLTKRVQKLSSTGTFLTEWGSGIPFSNPVGICVDEQLVYVVDFDLGYVFVFTSDGLLLRQWGTPGTGEGELLHPTGIAVDGLGHVFVADTYNHRIQKFTGEGEYLLAWGTKGNGDGEFVSFPSW